MGQKQEIHAEANAEHTSGPHDVGRPLAAPHHMAAAAGGRQTVLIHHVTRWYFQHLPPHVISVFASYYIFYFCPILYFLLLAHIVFPAVCVISFPVNKA